MMLYANISGSVNQPHDFTIVLCKKMTAVLRINDVSFFSTRVST